MVYQPEQTKRAVLQFLETTHIITTTVNLDICIGRYELLEIVVKELRSFATSPRYISDMSEGAEVYKTMYYDRLITEEQFLLLSNISNFDLSNYFITKLHECCLNFIHKTLEEVKLLTKKEAKKKRLLNLASKIGLAINFIENTFGSNTEDIVNFKNYFYKILLNKTE